MLLVAGREVETEVGGSCVARRGDCSSILTRAVKMSPLNASDASMSSATPLSVVIKASISSSSPVQYWDLLLQTHLKFYKLGSVDLVRRQNLIHLSYHFRDRTLVATMDPLLLCKLSHRVSHERVVVVPYK